jgi:transcriptional regulator with XRE-family HTH domain/quercetin dioxygenase-like cupin family protein
VADPGRVSAFCVSEHCRALRALCKDLRATLFLVVEPWVKAAAPATVPQRGQRLRQAREARGISLRELARRLNVSPGHVSQIERDIAAPSISLLYSIVTELGVSMDALFDDSPTDSATGLPAEPAGAARTTAAGGRSVPVPGEQGDAPARTRTPATGGDGEARYVRRAADRPVIMASPGVRWELLTPSAQAAVDFREIIYEPAAEEAEMIRHPGHEYGVVLEGQVHIQVEFETFVLGPGDSIGFESYRPHRFWNEGPERARTIWVSNVQD